MGNEGRNSGVSTFFAFLIGGIAGACLGLLLAPAAGHETRKWIRDTSVTTKERAENAVHKAVETAREGTRKCANLGKGQIRDTAQNLKAAVEAGTRAYKDKKEEIDNDLSQTGETTEPKDNDDAA